MRGSFLIWDSTQEVHPLSCIFWTLPSSRGSKEEGKRAEKKEQWARKGSVSLLFILWVCYHHSVNLLFFRLEEGKVPAWWVALYLFDSFPTCPLILHFSLLTSSLTWKDRGTIILVKKGRTIGLSWKLLLGLSTLVVFTPSYIGHAFSPVVGGGPLASEWNYSPSVEEIPNWVKSVQNDDSNLAALFKEVSWHGAY